MKTEITAEAFCKRVESVINERYGGVTARLTAACQDFNKSIGENVIYTFLKRRTFTGTEVAATIAHVSGVSLDWLAGVKTDKPYIDPKLTQEPIGTPTVREFASEYSVESEGKPEPTVYPGFQIGDQLTIDFIVRGKSGRQVIHAGPKDTGNDT